MTPCTDGGIRHLHISTHTSLAGRDHSFSGRRNPIRKFLLTRPSRDVTPILSSDSFVILFLLTRPSRDVTHVLADDLPRFQISTHTSLAGRDSENFSSWQGLTISTHTSLAGRDSAPFEISPSISISTHTSLAGRDFTDPPSF